MAWGDGQVRVCALVVQNAQVAGTGTHDDFPGLLIRANFDSETWSPTDANRAQEDGGDLRFAMNEDGTGQLAHEIVTSEYDSVDGAGNAEIEIWVKIDELLTATDTTIYVAYNTAGTTAADSVTDSFGRNNVWSDYLLVHHLQGSGTAIDSTGNGHDGTLTNSPTNSNGFLDQAGGAFDFDGNNDYIDFGDKSAFSILKSGDPAFTISHWINVDSEASDQHIISKRVEWATSIEDITSSNSAVGPRFNTYGDNNLDVISDSISLNTWTLIHAKVTPGTGAEVLVNGVTDGGADTITDVSANDSFGMLIGATYSSSSTLQSHFNGGIDEVRIRESDESIAWSLTEYNNQSDPAAFIIAGTPSDVSASGGVEILRRRMEGHA